MGATLGQLAHLALPATNESVLMAGLMVALCVGVTKTPLGTTLVVTEMTGLPLLPVTLIAAVVALILTSPLTIIETQRARDDQNSPSP
jgi:H+/Cl- antiporter ClcA